MKLRADTFNSRPVKPGIFICLLLLSPLIAAESFYDYSISSLLENDQTTTRQFNQRFGYNATQYHDDLMSSPQLSLEELDNVSLMSDWHPGRGLFRLSAGILYQPENTNNRSYSLPIVKPNVASGFIHPGEDGVLPYVGMGLGSNVRHYSQLDFNLDMGLLYQPDQRIFNEEMRFSDSGSNSGNRLDDLGLKPVVSFGVSYSF